MDYEIKENEKYLNKKRKNPDKPKTPKVDRKKLIKPKKPKVDIKKPTKLKKPKVDNLGGAIIIVPKEKMKTIKNVIEEMISPPKKN
jgi:hypothetical protein